MHGVRALLALAAALGLGWLQDWSWQLMPVLLGVVASALTETDDNWRGRLHTQVRALVTFLGIAALVWWAQASPWVLAGALALCAFVLTMVGAMGERFRALAFASLVFFIYVALSLQSSRKAAGQLVPYLWGGAAWYGLVSVAWAAAVARPPVRHRLAQVYALLGEYLQLKSRLLEPIHDVDSEQRRMAVALYNGLVVDGLAAAKDALACRLALYPGTLPGWLQEALHQYLCAQDIHERSSSSHEQYDTLAHAFFRSDALYRCQRVLALQGQQCLKLSAAIARRKPPQHQGATGRAIADMQGAIAEAARTLPHDRPLRALQALGDNLAAQAAVLAQVLAPTSGPTERTLVNDTPRTLGEAWARVGSQLRLSSPLCRHAIRLALALLVGVAAMHLIHDHHGYWIVLTITFVSQPHYAATLKRLGQRVGGTAMGLATGWALMRLFPDDVSGSVLIAASGALFLGTRRTHYAVATGAITTMLLMAFHQLGMTDGVITGRLLDTLLGGAIAGLAAWLILPTWQARRWPALAAATLRAQAHYLDEVMRQYQSGKHDHLAYRVARRHAHQADANLSNALAAMRKEPPGVRLNTDDCGRFLLRSHTMLAYLSGLGAHRGEPGATELDRATLDTAAALRYALLALAQAIELRAAHPRAPAASQGHNAAVFDLGPLEAAGFDQLPTLPLQRVVRTQLSLAAALMPQLVAAAPA